VVEEPMLVDTAVELAAGDAIMFLTDGVEEARRDDGEFYGDVRICTAIERAARAPIGVSAASLVDAVRADLDAFRGDQSARDDIVILAVRHENPDLRPSERPHSRQDICELPVSVDDGQTT
jgi:serine phosphatase RsbU (regulator of sigma subunit)